MTTSRTLKIQILFLLLIQVLLTGLLFTPHNDPALLRVAYVPGELAISRLSPYGPGFDSDLVRRFCARHNRTPQWLPAPSIRQAVDLVQRNRADIVICPAACTLSHLPDLQTGPSYRTDQPLIVHNRWRQALLAPEDLCQSRLMVSSGTGLLQPVKTLTRTLECNTTRIDPLGPGLPTLLNDMTQDRERFAVVGDSAFKLWQPFFPDIRPSLDLHQRFKTLWAWRTSDEGLSSSLRAFWKTTPSSDFFQEVRARYLGFLPSKTDFYELEHLFSVIEKKLPRYSETIRAAARKYDFDPLLLTAMIYQESHFNPRARSKTGVRGLLQISQTTARELGITNRLLPKASIMGGAKYLRGLADRLDHLNLDPWNKLFFALAAYNQGMGHLTDALTLTKQQGRNDTAWREVKKVFPLLSYSRYYTRTTHGYCRGFEAVDYVQSIRYYYYVLTGLVRLARPEGENLAVLASGGPADGL